MEEKSGANKRNNVYRASSKMGSLVSNLVSIKRLMWPKGPKDISRTKNGEYEDILLLLLMDLPKVSSFISTRNQLI